MEWAFSLQVDAYGAAVVPWLGRLKPAGRWISGPAFFAKVILVLRDVSAVTSRYEALDSQF